MFDLMICNIEHTMLIEYNFSAYFHITMHVQVLPALPPEGGGQNVRSRRFECLCCLQESLNQTDANFSGQRSSMQGQQRPLSFLEHRQASLRVNTCTDSCGRGSSPAPYSPPSAETAVGGGEGLTLTCL